MLQSMGLQRVGHGWVTEQQQQLVSLLFLYSTFLCYFKIVNCQHLFKGKHCGQAQVTKWLRPNGFSYFKKAKPDSLSLGMP